MVQSVLYNHPERKKTKELHLRTISIKNTLGNHKLQPCLLKLEIKKEMPSTKAIESSPLSKDTSVRER